jgi:hypothetical protein
MRVLHLTLKKKWFDMIASGEKTEEYREIKKYWIQRICDDHPGNIGGDLMDAHTVCAYTFRPFKHCYLRLGYRTDAPQLLREIKEIVIDTGKPEWGAEPGKKYFVIKLGERLTSTELIEKK